MKEVLSFNLWTRMGNREGATTRTIDDDILGSVWKLPKQQCTDDEYGNRGIDESGDGGT